MTQTSIDKTSTAAYVPGVCNINTAEIAYRRKAGFILLAVSFVLTVPFFVTNLPAWSCIVLFFPLFLTVLSFLQAKHKFCVSYGAAGQQNATDGDRVAQDVVDEAARKLDKARTAKIKREAAFQAAVVTAGLVLLSFLSGV